MIISEHNKAAELEALIRVLLEAPAEGMTIDEIQLKTGWENSRVHHRLLDLSRQVGNQKLRVNKVRSTYYFLKVR